MIAAFDVSYDENGGATAAAVVFAAWDSEAASNAYAKQVEVVAGYRSGSFLRRELPCILELFRDIVEPINTILVDGYVQLGDQPGLGAHLREALSGRVRVVGIAKSRYRGAAGVEVFRGASKKPLFVTASGMTAESAAEAIRSMHGPDRIPTLLRAVDRLSRKAAVGDAA